MSILVTGAAGFIGFHVAQRLLARGDKVVGIDSINDYYSVDLKFSRLEKLGIGKHEANSGKTIDSISHPNFKFLKLNLENKEGIDKLFAEHKFNRVCNLAAQAGVRYSIENPMAYIDSNIVGFINILESCRHHNVEHLAYASSSSVYGLNETMPFSTSHNVDHPISLYAASKKSNELMAHTYSYLFKIPTTGLRFFTVYGPWGRPDMALFLFTKAIIEGKPIDVFNNGDMSRDFTYIDDITEGIVRVIDNPPLPDPIWSGAKPNPSSSVAPYRIYNIGNSSPVKLLDFIEAIETAIGIKAKKKFLPLQAGDVPTTWANVDDLWSTLDFKPSTTVNSGISKFVEWYKDYYKVK